MSLALIIRVEYSEEKNMVRLETVEDFEKVKPALDDPNSKSYQYCVKRFGFCTACNKLTEYDDDGPTSFGCRMCLSCKRVFEFRFDEIKYAAGECYVSHDRQEYYTLLSCEHYLIKEFERLHSREHQMKLFDKERETYIKKLKRNVKESNNKIRRLAKLRTTKKQKDDQTQWALDHLS